jgi:hypothetical protein
MGTKSSVFVRCMTSKRLAVFAVALVGMCVLAALPASAQTCLQNEYNLVQKQKLNCTANDVRIAEVTNIRDPQTGATLSTCFQGTTFSFIADFKIVTTSSQARENIGLYIQRDPTKPDALFGSCVDNIVSPQHQCPGALAGINCGSDNYHETDPAPDNCGDTSSGDNSPTFGAGAEKVTLLIDNFLCQAPAGSSTLVLPNCTSWQIPGGTIQCVSPSPSFPYPFNGPGGTPTAIPGSPSKCNCAIINLPITPVTVTPTVAKACTTALNPGLNTTCDAGAEGSTVTYTVSITNTSNIAGNNVVVDQICDDQYGNIFTASGFSPACAAGKIGTATNVNCPPGPIAPGDTQSCKFTVVQGELKSVTDIANASGHSSVNTSSKFLNTQSNSVTVTSSDAPSTATTTKGFVGTIAGCATVRYSVDVHNTSGADEVLTLSGLQDAPYGDLTKLGNGAPLTVLGTNCGVATGQPGLGTFANGGGPTGAGAFSTIPIDGHYTCQFDGQFCSALDSGNCIQNSDKVTATLAGDEGEAVTQTGNTLTVQECFTSHVSSAP